MKNVDLKLPSSLIEAVRYFADDEWNLSEVVENSGDRYDVHRWFAEERPHVQARNMVGMQGGKGKLTSPIPEGRGFRN